MRHWHWQAVWILLVVLGVGIDGASAEGKRGLRLFRKDTPHAVAVPAGDPAFIPVPPGANAHGPAPTAGALPRVRAALNSHGLGCQSDYNEIQSGSFHSTAAFIFGSSRNFFREGCEPNPPLLHGKLFSGKSSPNSYR